MSHPLFDLSGQKALVTGAGRGIGATLALGLAQAGADVAIADIDLTPADEGRRAIEALGRGCTHKNGSCGQQHAKQRCDAIHW